MATATELESFVSSVTCPPDFDSFWEGVLAELKDIPLEPEIASVPLRSTPDVNVHEVHYVSLGGIRIAGWYCVPAKGSGPFPTLIEFPGYKSEPSLPRAWAQRGVAILSVAVRGKLRSNEDFNPGYPGLLVSGMDSPDTYAYRGVISDCSRGVDFLLTTPGGGQGANIRPRCKPGRRPDPDCHGAPVRNQRRGRRHVHFSARSPTHPVWRSLIPTTS